MVYGKRNRKFGIWRKEWGSTYLEEIRVRLYIPFLNCNVQKRFGKKAGIRKRFSCTDRKDRKYWKSGKKKVDIRKDEKFITRNMKGWYSERWKVSIRKDERLEYGKMKGWYLERWKDCVWKDEWLESEKMLSGQIKDGIRKNKSFYPERWKVVFEKLKGWFCKKWKGGSRKNVLMSKMIV